MLKVDALEVAYGPVRALRGLSMHMAQGEVVALVGANGAGKSTLMKTLIGVLRPRSGSITFNGQPLHRLTPPAIVRAGIAISPEGRRVFPDMSVDENLRLGASQRRASPADLDEIYAWFPALATRRGLAAGRLSGGQQQLVAIGRALMAKPSLLLLDEPSLGLAPRVVGEIARIILAIRERGIAVLLAEQNARMALRLSRRAYVLRTGTVIQTGSSEQLLADPEVQHAYLGVSDARETEHE